MYKSPRNANKVVYLDCNATTPVDSSVQDAVIQFLGNDFGNAGSRTHVFGQKANQAVAKSRQSVANVVKCDPAEVIFTSGATESSNIAILGLAKYAEESKKKHIITTAIEHKAVLGPIDYLSKQGFDITVITPTSGGWIPPEKVTKALRDETILVSIMQVNNETGVIQPLDDIAEILSDHEAFFHTDASQGFGKVFEPLNNPRIDLISISGHKCFAPKGIGALITRRRNLCRLPLTPLMYGGGQERRIRPGTLPVHLIVGLGVAADLAIKDHQAREEKCRRFRREMLEAFDVLNPIIHGDPERTQSHVVNLSIPGLDAEAVMLALKEIVAISNGSACTSDSYEPSHVLTAMGLSDDDADTALRWSWCHLTEQVNWNRVIAAIQDLM